MALKFIRLNQNVGVTLPIVTKKLMQLMPKNSRLLSVTNIVNVTMNKISKKLNKNKQLFTGVHIYTYIY